MSRETAISILVVNDDKRGLVRRRRIRVSVRRVDFQADKPFVRAQRKEHSHTRLFDATGVCVGQFELRGRTRRPVATVACLSSAVALDDIAPVLSKND